MYSRFFYLNLIVSFHFSGSVLCVGSEWHRFPSSFFVPSYVGEVRWIDDGFQGLLPFPFNTTIGGTTAAPHYFNNKNKASNEQYVISCPLKNSHGSSCLYFPHSLSCVISKLTASCFHWCSSGILIPVLSLWSWTWNGHILLAEVTYQYGR